MLKGKLYLFPTPLSEAEINTVIPEYNLQLIRNIKNFIAEDAKTARRFLKLCAYPKIEDATITLLNEHTVNADSVEFLKPLFNGNDVGLMSDAGCPGIADPGASVVKLAHKSNIKVIPLIGPSSILLTAMASGFNGQNFAFVGYLPIEKPQRSKKIKELEQLAKNYKQAQYFIETPYRNTQLMADLLSVLNPQASICLGINLTHTNQLVVSKTVADWKKSEIPPIHKTPVVFGVYF